MATGLPIGTRRVFTEVSPILPADQTAADVWERTAHAIGQANDGFQRAADAERALTFGRSKLDAQAKLDALQDQYRTDPDGFDKAAGDLKQSIIAGADPSIARALDLYVDGAKLQRLDGIRDARFSRDQQLQKQTWGDLLDDNGRRLSVMAGSNKMGSPDFTAGINERDGLLQLGMAQGYISPEQADIDRRSRVDKLHGDWIKGQALTNPQFVLDAAKQFGVAGSGTFVPPADRASLPAGMRNNNPGNIKYIAGSPFKGVVGPSENTDQGDPQMVFATADDGMAAAVQLAQRKYQGGKTTANQLIAGQGGWTPGNATAAANVAKSMGLRPDEDLNLTDPGQMKRFMRGLVRQEHGAASDRYGDEMIARAVDGGGAGPTGLNPFEGLPAGEAMQAINLAQGQVNEQRAVARADVLPRAKDEETLALRGDKPASPLSQADFVKAYGPDEGTRQWMSLQGAYQVGAVVKSVALMTPGDQQATLTSMAPAGEGAADQAENQTRLRQAIERDQASRKEDPAAHVMQYSQSVRTAAAAYQQDPSRLGDLVSRSIETQQQIGIPVGDQRALPKQVVENLSATYASGSTDVKTAVLDQIGTVPEQYRPKLIEQIAGDRPVLALAAGMTKTAPAIARSLVSGDAALQADSKFGPSPSDYDMNARDQLNGVLRGAPQAMGLLNKGIMARYADLSAQAGDASGTLDTDRLDQAVTDVTGGIVEWQDHKVLAPVRGMSQDAFESAMDKITPEQIAGMKTVKGTDVPLDVFKDDAWLVDYGPGQYLVAFGDSAPQFALGADGKPFVLTIGGGK